MDGKDARNVKQGPSKNKKKGQSIMNNAITEIKSIRREPTVE